MERELGRVIARLDVLHQALEENPVDVELLAEARGQQRALTSLSAALEKMKPAGSVTPLQMSPLDRLRADYERRRYGSGTA